MYRRRGSGEREKSPAQFVDGPGQFCSGGPEIGERNRGCVHSELASCNGGSGRAMRRRRHTGVAAFASKLARRAARARQACIGGSETADCRRRFSLFSRVGRWVGYSPPSAECRLISVRWHVDEMNGTSAGSQSCARRTEAAGSSDECVEQASLQPSVETSSCCLDGSVEDMACPAKALLTVQASVRRSLSERTVWEGASAVQRARSATLSLNTDERHAEVSPGERFTTTASSKSAVCSSRDAVSSSARAPSMMHRRASFSGFGLCERSKSPNRRRQTFCDSYNSARGSPRKKETPPLLPHDAILQRDDEKVKCDPLVASQVLVNAASVELSECSGVRRSERTDDVDEIAPTLPPRDITRPTGHRLSASSQASMLPSGYYPILPRTRFTAGTSGDGLHTNDFDCFSRRSLSVDRSVPLPLPREPVNRGGLLPMPSQHTPVDRCGSRTLTCQHLDRRGPLPIAARQRSASATTSEDARFPARGAFVRRDNRVFLEVTQKDSTQLVEWSGSTPSVPPEPVARGMFAVKNGRLVLIVDSGVAGEECEEVVWKGTRPDILTDKERRFDASLPGLCAEPWYFHHFSRGDAEKHLEKMPEGTYLVRPCESRADTDFSLTIKLEDYCVNFRIPHGKNGYVLFSPDHRSSARYAKHNLGEFVATLSKATQERGTPWFCSGTGRPFVLKTPAVHIPRLQDFCRAAIRSRVRRHHVNDLPLPTNMKRFLKVHINC